MQNMRFNIIRLYVLLIVGFSHLWHFFLIDYCYGIVEVC